MNPLADVEIHGILIGIVGSGIQFHVGQKVRVTGGKEATITHIVRHETMFPSHKDVLYTIHGDIDGDIKIIKFAENQPNYGSCITEL